MSPSSSSAALLRSPASDVSDAQLVAALLSEPPDPRASRQLAADVLELTGGLARLVHAPDTQLREAGLSNTDVARLRALPLVLDRLASDRATRRPLDARAVDALFRPTLAALPHEELHVVLLDGRAAYAGRRRIAVGGDGSVAVRPRDVLAPVIEARFPRFALVHNHPSGACAPSPEDVALTTRLVEASRVVGAQLVDHLVIASDGFTSAMPDGARWPGASTLRRVL